MKTQVIMSYIIVMLEFLAMCAPTWAVAAVPAIASDTATYYIDAVNGSDLNNGLRPETAFATVQKGIDAATDGDTVIVARATYYENINLNGKNITLRSTDPNDPDVVSSTVIDGRQANSVVTFDSGESADCILSGLTITNGKSECGGGIYAAYGTSLTLTNCIIRDSSAREGGGVYSCSLTATGCTFTGNSVSGGSGIYGDGNVTLTNCTLSNNSAGAGGGLSCFSNTHATLTNCIFERNSATWAGGGFYSEPINDLAVNNCTFTRNTADLGGCMFGVVDRMTITNCHMTQNSARLGGALNLEAGGSTMTNTVLSENTAAERGGAVFLLAAVDGGLAASNCTFVKNTSPEGNAIFCTEWAWECSVTNSILYDGGKEIAVGDATALEVTYSVVQGGWPGTGNIHADPRLAADGYHLGPGSPCINAGDPAADYAGQTDIDGEPRVVAGRIDVGADEFHLEDGPAIYYVDANNGSDTFNGLSHETAFATVQRGIDSSKDGDTVLVYPGVYAERIFFLGKAITVQSAEDAAMLEGLGEFAVSFYKGEGPESVLRNFVIRNCIVGVVVVNASPTISNVTVVDNEFGIAAYAGAEPNITNSIFWNNTNADLWECQARYSWVQEEIEPEPPEEPEGLVSHWSFDEGTGATAHDSVGGKHGTIHGAQRTTGPIGGALSFDGVDDYVELPDNSPVWLPQYDFSLSVWVYLERGPDFPTNELILDLNYGNSTDPYNELGCILLFHSQYDPRSLGFHMHTTTSTDEDLHANEIPVTNRWYHIVAVRDGATQAIYVDGRLDKSRTCSPDPVDFVGGYDDNKVNVGRYTTTIGQPRYYLQGGIDDVRIYDRALSAEDVQQLYQIGLDGSGSVSNPLFADPANDDYHLLSERGRYWPEHDVWVLDKVTSPCIDGGDPNADYSNEPTPNGGRINMGAYGGTHYASMSEMQWFDPDVNGDGVVDISDILELIDLWLEAAGWGK